MWLGEGECKGAGGEDDKLVQSTQAPLFTLPDLTEDLGWGNPAQQPDVLWDLVAPPLTREAGAAVISLPEGTSFIYDCLPESASSASPSAGLLNQCGTPPCTEEDVFIPKHVGQVYAIRSIIA